MKNVFASFVTVLALTTALATGTTARASEFAPRPLDPSILAQVNIFGGFMAPIALHSTRYSIKKNGDVVRLNSSPNTKHREVFIKRLSAETQARLERAISQIHEGELVDLDPQAPHAADAPTTSYSVNLHGFAVKVALRAGNLHTYMLRQKAAPVIKRILDQATAE